LLIGTNYLFKEKKIILMSKGIAISTILYLLVGVLVVGIVVYLVYTYVMNPILPETQCRALATSWCTSCSAVDFTGGPDASSDLQGCAGEYWTAPAWGDCEGQDVEDFCSTCCGIS